MLFDLRRVQVWRTEIPDRPGAAASKLELLARVGANLQFVFTRPDAANPDTSLLFLAPIEGEEQIAAAKSVGFEPARAVTMLRIEGKNCPGIGYEVMSKLAVGGINLKGLSLSSIGDRFVAYLAFDNPDAATLAVQILATMIS
ncbi:MAG: hypothetical protein KatS3mg105_0839 [Gemmatales bacterium]|nr:MAG: hypothetical protein KatS3mg105_0839 [Gemmatales bacterium]